ncbi:MAG: ABC transporter ATP-binding protein [Chloroflexi bacterium]|nr:ABC transporter ATP-binding protein [Chloroflexota bacterium]
MAIARAVVIELTFEVADEPMSMLDVSLRPGVMNLMKRLAERLQISYLYITHDLAVARHMCSRIAVMYLGKIVEKRGSRDVLQEPKQPYTQALLSAIPVPDPTVKRAQVQISGVPPGRWIRRLGAGCIGPCLIADEFCPDSLHPGLKGKGSGQRADYF